MHRAQAGTAGKCVPPHIPIGGVWVPPPPGNECEMFMGSATVEVDGDAQSYMSLPALSCQSIGMPTIPRLNPKKKTKPKCLMLPLSFVLPIPAGPPVMIGGPPTISIMGLAMKAGLAALGKLAKALRKLQKGTGRVGRAMAAVSKAVRDKVSKLGIADSIRNKINRAICAVTGHPVDIATGKVFTDAFDFELPGPLPFKWERVWFSTSVYRGPLGHGWHHGYDLGLVAEDDAVVVRMADGRAVAFPAIGVGESSFERKERLTLRRDSDGYSMVDNIGLSWRFGQVTFDSAVQKLLTVSDRVGHKIQFRYDKYGHLEEIIDSAERRLSVASDAQGRITEIRGPHPEKTGQTISLVSYEYDSDGRLIVVRDALSQPMIFRYDGSLLVRETDRNGLNFYFEYDGSDEHARCIHTWGDGGIYNHRLKYDLVLKQTNVTNSLGQSTLHFWNDEGLVFRSIDPLGGVKETTFSEFNQPLSEIDELGQATLYEYDDRGNQILTVTPDEAQLEFVYNEIDLPVRATNAIGKFWFWDYNDFGQLTKRKDPTGRETRFDYAARRLAAIIDPAGNATQLGYDKAGNLDAVTLPAGGQSRWQYDQLGRPVAVSDPRGNVQRREHDALGRVTQVIEADGNLRTLRYDAMGNVVYAKDLQHEVRFTYQGMNRMASRREAGTTVRFNYNTEEDLIAISNDSGHVYRFELDERRNVAREFGFDDIRRIYTRDSAGRLIRVERASGVTGHYEYDRASRITRVHYSDGTKEEYAYRKDGQLIEAANDGCIVKFDRDAVGRILKESQNDFWVTSEYGPLGLRTTMRSSLGAFQTIERNALGDVTGMQFRDESSDASRILWETQIQRDQMGLELERTLPGGVRSRWERDKLGRPLRHQIVGGTGHSRDAKYDWGVNDRLQKIIDTHQGTTTFEHDELGNLASATYSDGTVELRMPDAVGNLFRTRDRSDRKYGPAGQLLEAKTEKGLIRYTYDADGNLIRKTTPEGEWRYRWNAAGLLVCVVRPDLDSVEFEYDSLSRRTAKFFRTEISRCFWDGNVPLHEFVDPDVSGPGAAGFSPVAASAAETTRTAGLRSAVAFGQVSPEMSVVTHSPNVVTWLYDPESFAPAARLSNAHSDSVVTDYLGTPAALTDMQGHTVRSDSLTTYGASVNTRGAGTPHCRRWPGLFEDLETGLCYNRYRYYDPESGTYISQDPIGLAGSLSFYRYVSDVTNRIDPLGLTQCPPKKLGLGLWQKHRPAFDEWAKANDLQRYGALSGSGSFSKQINDAMGAADQIHVRLDDLNPKRANSGLNDFGEPSHGYTNYELAMIRDNPDYFAKTTFWKDGQAMPPGYNPFT